MRWNCMNWTSRSARPAMSAASSSACFEPGIERGDLGDAVDQHLVVEPADRFPVDRIAERVGISFGLALQLGALDAGERIGVEVVVEPGLVRVDLAIGGRDLHLVGKAEAGDALQKRC
jgi:hypothetical protein